MKSMAMRITVILLAISLVAVVVGCAAPAAQTKPAQTTTTTAAPKVLKYGCATALTGAGAVWGMEQKRAHELLADYVNNNGGLKIGNDTYKLEMIIYDNKYNGPEGAAVAQRLIFQDQVKFMTLHLTVPSMPALPITTENKIMTFNSIYAAAGIGPTYPYNFRCQYTALEAAEGMYGYITTKLTNVKNVAVISNDDDSGKANVAMST